MSTYFHTHLMLHIQVCLFACLAIVATQAESSSEGCRERSQVGERSTKEIADPGYSLRFEEKSDHKKFQKGFETGKSDILLETCQMCDDGFFGFAFIKAKGKCHWIWGPEDFWPNLFDRDDSRLNCEKAPELGS